MNHSDAEWKRSPQLRFNGDLKFHAKFSGSVQKIYYWPLEHFKWKNHIILFSFLFFSLEEEVSSLCIWNWTISVVVLNMENKGGRPGGLGGRLQVIADLKWLPCLWDRNLKQVSAVLSWILVYWCTCICGGTVANSSGGQRGQLQLLFPTCLVF